MTLMDYMNQGGAIMYILFAFNIVGITLLIWKSIVITSEKRKSKQLTLKQHEVVEYIQGLETGLNTVKIIASVAPLLGLLGTVIGILSAFEVIASKGLSDPSLFAGGISMALVTTVAGLIVAIPHFIGYNYLIGALDRFEGELASKAQAIQ